MRAHQINHEVSLPTDWTETIPPLRVVILYDNVAAGKRAMSVLRDLSKGLQDDIEVRPFPWSFELLAEPCWREVAEEDALQADILIVAISDETPLPPVVERWTQAIVSQRKGSAAAVVALLATEEGWAQGGTSRVEALRLSAQQAGLAFFASGTPRSLDAFWERELHPTPQPERDQIPDSDPPLRWGLNE